MTIGIHAVALFKKNRTGVEEYVYQLLKHLVSLEESKKHKFILYSGSDGSLDFSFPSNFEIKILKFPILWTQLRLSWEMFFNPPDVLFIPAHILPLIHPKNSIVVVHDLEFEHFKKAYSFFFGLYLSLATKYSCFRSKKIIVPSENTKNNLIKFYNLNQEKIKVIYHGANFVKDIQTGLLVEWEKFKPYFFYIGRIEFKKNIRGIIKAFEIFREKYRLDCKLILAGGDGFGAKQLKEEILASKYRKDIILKGYVSPEEKCWLFKNAEIFLFPSFYEGFGMPILEAQFYGVPVITSNISSMPEIAGNGAVLVNSQNVEEIAEAMAKLTNDSVFKTKIIDEGYKNIKRFSWQKCAEETLSTLIQAP